MMKKMMEYVEQIRPAMEVVKWENPHDYANFLSQSYYIASRSTSFLGMCLFHAHKYPDFQARCTEHIAEETGHEKLIVNDLKFLGQPMHPELASTMAFYQPQYFRIVAENPLSFLGYVFFLELVGPIFGEYIMARAVKADKRALTFVRVHTRADDGHLESAMEVFQKLPEEFHEGMWSNFHMSLESYGRMLEQVASGRAASYKKAG